MACLVLVYELILKAVKVHKGDKLLQLELIGRNTGSIIKGRCTLCAHCSPGSKSLPWNMWRKMWICFCLKLTKKKKYIQIKSDCVSDPWRSHFSFYNESFTMLVGGEFMTTSRALELCFNEYCLFCAQRTWTRTWLTQYTFPVLASGYSAYRQQVVVTSGKKRSNVLSKGENVFEEGQETQFLDLKDTNNVFW